MSELTAAENRADLLRRDCRHQPRFGLRPVVAKLGLGFVQRRRAASVTTPGTLTTSVIDQNQRSSGGVLAEAFSYTRPIGRPFS